MRYQQALKWLFQLIVRQLRKGCAHTALRRAAGRSMATPTPGIDEEGMVTCEWSFRDVYEYITDPVLKNCS